MSSSVKKPETSHWIMWCYNYKV